MDFDPGVGTAVAMLGTGAKDAFLAKYSSTGALEWVWVNTNGNSDNDVASGVAVGPDDSVYVVGQFEGTLDFDKNAGTTDLVVTGSPSADYNHFIARYDSDGDLLWARTSETSTWEEAAFGVAVDDAGAAVVVGSFKGTVDFDWDTGTANLITPTNDANHFLAKYDINGNLVWARTSDTSLAGEEYATAVALDDAGNAHVVGYFSGTVDFDDSGATALLTADSPGYYYPFVAKYDTNGDLLWARAPETSSTFVTQATSVGVDGSGNVFVAGYFDGTMNLDGTTSLIATVDGSTNYFVAKYSSTGDLLWGRTTGDSTSSEFANALSIDAEGSVYVSGSFDGTVDFDSTAAISVLETVDDANTSANNFTAKYDSAGNFLWVKSSQLPPNSEFDAQTIFSTAIHEGMLYSTGGFNGTVDFDPGPDQAIVDSGENQGKHFLTIQTLPYESPLPGEPEEPTDDTIPPAMPAIGGFGSNTGNPNDRSTTDQTLVFYGRAEAGSTITLFRNIPGQGWVAIGTATADAEGNWIFDYTGTKLPHAEHAFHATATDPAGNTSPMSDDFVVTIKYVEGVDGFGGPGSIIYGHSFGNDWVVGSENADSIRGGAGDDTMMGMDGSDRLFGDNGNDVINGNRGDDEVHGGNGDDTVMGGQGNDWVFGDDGNDWLNGNLGNDVVEGAAGNDTLHGGQGMDQLLGGAGNDVLAGDLGNDTLTGGGGSDQFYFGAGSGQDEITDFTVGADQVSIDLTGGMINGVAIASLADLLARIADTPDGAYLDLGDGQGILLAGVAKAQLSADQFLLV
ncbi:hypothetical protein STVA_52050 [Allostella vacuolata]|nr:hypothetical protein STVA_52050 [Stella vacuolata]